MPRRSAVFQRFSTRPDLLRRCFLCIVAAYASFPVQAQEPLSLKAAVTIALEKNHGLVTAGLKREQADLQNSPGEAGMLPAVSINGVYEKPFFGGIIKPKVGMSPEVLLRAVIEMVEGGVNFIKEDELLGNPEHCPLKTRVSLISKWLEKNAPNVIYCFCINGDSPYALERAQIVEDGGGNGIHINVWSGLGAYRAIRKQNPNLWIHFQKSGDKFFTDRRAPFHIYWPVICKIAGWSGVDSIHAGMIGGYMNQDEEELKTSLQILWKYNIVPALSCGMHPGLVSYINQSLNSFDWMANVGGAMHGHPSGTRSGGLAMLQSINGLYQEKEYQEAIAKWGNKEFNSDLAYRYF